MADIVLSAFSLFFMGSPSFLAHQRRSEEGQGRANCQSLFGIDRIPTDAPIRQAGRRPTGGIRRGVPQVLIALDGTEPFCSRKIHCPRCLHRRRADGGEEYFHSFLGASLLAPGHAQVLPLAPGFITPQDGASRQDCARTAARRWLGRHGPGLASLRPVCLGDDLFACQPTVAAIGAAGGSFILTCKPSSHQTISEYLHGGEPEEHREIVVQHGTRVTTLYRWMTAVPLRASADAITVTWFSIETHTAAGKRTYADSFVTDLPVSAANVADLAACGRARWKIENETFNVLKCGGYNLEHDFGHGKKTLASVLVVLNLLAFAAHTAARLACQAWAEAMAARKAADRFFEHLRTITAYVVFRDWEQLLGSITDAAIRLP